MQQSGPGAGRVVHFQRFHCAVLIILFIALLAPPPVKAQAIVNLPGGQNAPTIGGWGVPFGAPRVLSPGVAGAHTVAVADMDRDGHLDVVAAGREDGVVRLFRNNGLNPPDFQEVAIAQLPGAYQLQLADFDGDARIDVLVAHVGELRPSAADVATPQTGGYVVLLKNVGGGPLPAFVAFPIANLNYPVSVFAGDLDGDGDMDAASASRDDNLVIWYENNGQPVPAFTTHVLAADMDGAVSVQGADLDGDGDLDLVAASEDDNQISWFRNDRGTPAQFTRVVIRQPTPPNPNFDFAKAVYPADVDGDGDMDIVYASEGENEIGWYQNSGGPAPVFTRQVVSGGLDHIKAVYAGDLDGDGDVDLLSASSSDHRVVWFENNGAPQPVFTPFVITNQALGARAVTLADLDGDGDLDVLSASRDDNQIVWYPNRTISRSALYPPQGHTILDIRSGARHVDAGDLDGDGDLDLLSVGNAGLYWYQNNGQSPPTFAVVMISTNMNGPRWVDSGDLDRDGDVDIVVASRNDHRLLWYENLGGPAPAFRERIVDSSVLRPRAVLIADIDGDGHMDLYSASDGDDQIAWFENDGQQPPSFTQHTVTRNALYARSVYAADLDGDGLMDLASASQQDNKIAWYKNLGGPQPAFQEFVVTVGAIGAQHVHADDMDGDGDIDLLSASEKDHTIAWYENTGGNPPIFIPRIVDQNALGVHAIYTGDADGDGDIDVFAAIEYTNTIAWYENLGGVPPTFVYHPIYTGALVAHGVYADDIDGDGDLDVVSASREDGKIAWYENLGGQVAVGSATGASATLVPGELREFMQVPLAHRGRAGDNALRINALEFVLRDAAGQPLSLEQIERRLRRVQVFRDACCNGRLDRDVDPLIADLDRFTLSAEGRLPIPFVADNPNVYLGPGESTTLFVVAEMAGSCSTIPPPFGAELVVSSATVSDGTALVPLLPELNRTLAGSSSTVVEEPKYLFISEIMADNDGGLTDPDEPGEYPDWIEIYNAGSAPIDLGGKYLTDDLAEPTKYRIPAGVVAPPRGFVLFIADGDFSQGALHTNFRLDRQGESVGLFDTDENGNVLLDLVTFGEQATDVSYGRLPTQSDTWVTLATPTPGQMNEDSLYSLRYYLPAANLQVNCPGQ